MGTYEVGVPSPVKLGGFVTVRAFGHEISGDQFYPTGLMTTVY